MNNSRAAIPAIDDGAWTIAQGDVEGSPTMLRFRPALAEVLGHPEFPRRLVITWEFGDDGVSGMPNAEQSQALASFESTVTSALDPEQLAVLAFVVTHKGTREWNYYIDDVELVGERINDALEEQPDLPIDLQCLDDPAWEELAALLQGVQGLE